MGESMKVLQRICHNRTVRTELEKSRDKLYRVAYSWCHDPYLADDLVQQTMIKALKSSSQLREIEQLDRWLFRILANCHTDHYRSRREFTSIEDTEPMTEVSAEDEAHQDETVLRVRNAIAELPFDQRQVLSLVDLGGFTYTEVSEVLGIPAGTVMSRLCRARRALKHLLMDLAPDNADMRSRIRRVK